MPTDSDESIPDRPTLTHEVEGSLQFISIMPADAGAVRLAIEYAQAIDGAQDRAKALELLGPRLLSALEALGLTPRARSAMKGGVPSHGSSPLDELRAKRASRSGNTAS